MSRRWLGVIAIVVIGGAVAAAQQRPDQVTEEIAVASDLADAAGRFVSALTPKQRAKAVFPFASDERLRWHFVPKPRAGIALKELDGAQRALADGLLGAALSRRGLVKATTIIALEEVLKRREGNAGRDPGAYHVSVFGEPSTAATWGFRIEGHHLSLNLTIVDGVRPVEAPTFFGANPAKVDRGYLADTRVLGREEDLGFRLLASLDDDQRRAAVYRSDAPPEILTGPGERLAALPGLPASRMTAGQRLVFDAILEEVTGNLPRELAARERARIAASAPADLVFTWAGGQAPGQGHYFRLSGPSFLYELDNTQSGANHVHTVWHARAAAGGDFGIDLLREHYDRSHAPAPASGTGQ